jgi:peptide/nickel transport system permease protein
MQMLPGDPALIMLGSDATKEQLEMLREELGLNDPILVQYFHWLGNVFQGDLGTTINHKEDVAKLIFSRLPITLSIGILALCVTVLIGVPLGVLAAVKRGTFIDSVVVVFTNFAVALPNFWLAVLGVYFISIKLGWLPVQGFVPPSENFAKSVQHLIMPVLILSTSSLASVTRQTRSSMLEVIRQDYIRTARSKGVMERMVILKHALRNALIPIITLLGLQLGHVVGMSVLIEQVFNIPGLGRLLVSAIFQKDFVIVQGCVLVIACIVAIANLIVDILYRYVDPRIQYE